MALRIVAKDEVAVDDCAKPGDEIVAESTAQLEVAFGDGTTSNPEVVDTTLVESHARTIVLKLAQLALVRDVRERRKAEIYEVSGDIYATNEFLEGVFAGGQNGILQCSESHGETIESFDDLIRLLSENSYETLLWFAESLGLEFADNAEFIGVDEENDNDQQPYEFGEETTDLEPLVKRLLQRNLFNVKVEIFRRVLLVREQQQREGFKDLITEIKGKLGLDGLQALIRKFERVLPRPLSQQKRFETFDLPASNNPANTRFLRALVAIRNLLQAEMVENADSRVIDKLCDQTAKFVLAILNPELEKVEYSIVSDVYGSEANVPDAENDNTRLRVELALKNLKKKYGIEHLDVIKQGTSIDCPEQCGFNVATAIAQAAKEDRNLRIDSEFVVLNNAARVKGVDGIFSAEASKSSPLLYFTFIIGGVLHKGLAYGYRTLSLLKNCIVDLYEIQGTDNGSQFRSLEFQQPIAVTSALADGNLPVCWKVKELALDVIPEPCLNENEYLYMGDDKFGNGLLSVPASKLLKEYLPEGESAAEVLVTLKDRETGKIIVAPKKYTITRSMGSIREGKFSIWESSTPDPAEVDRGFASIGVLKAKTDDINRDIVDLKVGSIVEIQPLERMLNAA